MELTQTILTPTKMANLTQISTEEAINHNQSEYNPIEWKRKINMMLKSFNGVFYTTDSDNEVYCIYETGGLKCITRMEYFSSMTNAGMVVYTLIGNTLEQLGALYFPKNEKGRNEMAQYAKLSDKLIFACVYFQI